MRLKVRIDRALVLVHRWSGVVLCLFFSMWFASGIVLHFVPFPSLSLKEKRVHAEPVNTSSIRIAPADALALTQAGTDLEGVKLISVGGMPQYVVSNDHENWVISAISGAPLPEVREPLARLIAERFGQTSVSSISGPVVRDQWTVQQEYDRWRPFYRVRLNDAEATELYISTRSGEVVQRTRRMERIANWCGAVMHWIYFTPIRANWPLWDQLVWWVSLAGLMMASIGVWLGVARTAAMRVRQRWSPFRGWMQWHHVLGLTTGVIVLTWIFSGWLSMDHGRLFSRDGLTKELATRLRGIALTEALEVPLERIQEADQPHEIDFEALASKRFLTTYDAFGRSRVIWIDTARRVSESLAQDVVLEALHTIWPSATPIDVDAGAERLFHLAEAGDAALAFAVDSPDTSVRRVYADGATGRLVAVLDRSRMAYAWCYYGLHTLNLPGLNTHSRLRTLVVLSLALGGFAFSATSLVIAVRRISAA